MAAFGVAALPFPGGFAFLADHPQILHVRVIGRRLVRLA
jgi:hypothetical protein